MLWGLVGKTNYTLRADFLVIIHSLDINEKSSTHTKLKYLFLRSFARTEYDCFDFDSKSICKYKQIYIISNGLPMGIKSIELLNFLGKK